MDKCLQIHIIVLFFSLGSGPAVEVTYSEWEEILLRMISPTSISGVPVKESQVFPSG